MDSAPDTMLGWGGGGRDQVALDYMEENTVWVCACACTRACVSSFGPSSFLNCQSTPHSKGTLPTMQVG